MAVESLVTLWFFRNPNTKRFQEPDNFSITACWSASDKLWSSTRPPSLILSVVEIFHGTLIRLRSCEEQKFDAKYPFYHWFQQCLPFQRWGEMGVSSWFHRLTTKQHVQIVSKIVQFVELTNLRILIWSKGLGMRQKHDCQQLFHQVDQHEVHSWRTDFQRLNVTFCDMWPSCISINLAVICTIVPRNWFHHSLHLGCSWWCGRSWE